jgi:hypothetical protein
MGKRGGYHFDESTERLDGDREGSDYGLRGSRTSYLKTREVEMYRGFTLLTFC